MDIEAKKKKRAGKLRVVICACRIRDIRRGVCHKRSRFVRLYLKPAVKAGFFVGNSAARYFRSNGKGSLSTFVPSMRRKTMRNDKCTETREYPAFVAASALRGEGVFPDLSASPFLTIPSFVDVHVHLREPGFFYKIGRASCRERV